jgi:hypothetical protein
VPCGKRTRRWHLHSCLAVIYSHRTIKPTQLPLIFLSLSLCQPPSEPRFEFQIFSKLYLYIYRCSSLYSHFPVRERLAKGWYLDRTAENGGGREIWGRVHDAETEWLPDPGDVRLPAAAEEKSGKWKDSGPTEERVFPTAWSRRSVHCVCFLEDKSGLSRRGYLIMYIHVVFVRTWNSLFCCRLFSQIVSLNDLFVSFPW